MAIVKFKIEQKLGSKRTETVVDVPEEDTFLSDWGDFDEAIADALINEEGEYFGVGVQVILTRLT